MSEPADLNGRLRALGPAAPKTLARAPQPPDGLRLRLRHLASLVRAAGPITGRVVLILRLPGGKPVVTPLKDKLVFGRHATCDLSVITDAELSRAHFQLVRDGENYFVEDLDSRNGTYVNDVHARVTRRELRNGDFILAGAQVLLFWRQECHVA